MVTALDIELECVDTKKLELEYSVETLLDQQPIKLGMSISEILLGWEGVGQMAKWVGDWCMGKARCSTPTGNKSAKSQQQVST